MENKVYNLNNKIIRSYQTNKAMVIAYEAHTNQLDIAGVSNNFAQFNKQSK